MKSSVTIIIAGVTILNMVAALWLIWWTARGSGKVSPTETTHVWDDDLTEYNHPLPRWWLWMFILTIAFAIGYLVFYPGLGFESGIKHWSSAAQWSAEKKQADSALEHKLTAIKSKSLMQLSQDSEAMVTGRNLFALNCSTCHGSDARGAKGFPNLTDGDWLWGGDARTVYQTISKGRDNAMPGWEPILGKEGVEKVLSYVLTLSGRLQRSTQSAGAVEDIDAGQKSFQTLCAACHGADGHGNQALGAPNLADQIWLHGADIGDIRETIAHGRINHMPAHGDLLGDDKVRLLAAYVLSISAPANATRSAEQDVPPVTVAQQSPSP